LPCNAAQRLRQKALAISDGNDDGDIFSSALALKIGHWRSFYVTLDTI